MWSPESCWFQLRMGGLSGDILEGVLTVSLFHDIHRGMMMAVRVRPNAGSDGRSVGRTFEQRHDV